MKPILFLLPLVGFVIGSLGTAIGNTYNIAYVSVVSWGIALLFVGIWIAFDYENLLKIFKRKGARYGASSGVVLLFAIIAIAGTAYITSKPRFNKNWDVTKNKLNTLSDQSYKILDKIKKENAPIKIKAFFAEEDAVKSNFVDLLALYQAEKPDLDVTYRNTSINFEEAKGENLTNPNTVIFRNGKNEARITIFNEQAITNALLKVMKNEVKKILFTKGHGEGDLDAQDASGYLFAKNELENNNYEVKQISLISELDELTKAAVVVIPGPRYDFSEQETKLLENYLEKGGAVFLLVSALNPVANLNKLTQKYGIQINSDLLVLNPKSQQAQIYGKNFALVNEFDNSHQITRDFANETKVGVLVSSTRSVSKSPKEVQNIRVEELAKTFAPLTIHINGVNSSKDLQGDLSKRVDTNQHSILTIATTPKSRLLVGGSSDLVTNVGTQDSVKRDLFVNSINYLAQDEDFIAIRPKETGKSTIDLTSSRSQLTLFFFSFLYPFLFLGSGMIYWLHRGRE